MTNLQEFSIVLHLLAREAARRNPVTVQPTASGGYDVVLRLDGTYGDLGQAQRVANMLTEALVANASPPAILPLSEVAVGPGSTLQDLLDAIADPSGEQLTAAQLLEQEDRR